MTTGISRRELLRMGLGAAGGMGLAALAGKSALANGGGGGTPNIVVIFVDDMGYGDLSVSPFTNTVPERAVDTPNLRRMADEGRKFTSFYVAGSVCTPSRCGLLTGRYPRRVSAALADAVLKTDSNNGLPLSEITLAEKLSAQGYATACIGKWHLGIGTQGLNGIAAHHEYLPTNQGFDTFLGTPVSNNAASCLIRGHEVIEQDTDQRWLVRRYTTESIKFMRKSKAQDKPFFLYLAHNMPHIDLYVSRQFDGKTQMRYYDVITEIDWSVGKVLDEIKRLGVEENTLVIFTSDNGPWLVKNNYPSDPKVEAGHAGPYREGKGSTFEGGFREPMIAWWPGRVPANTTEDRPATALDLYPSLVTLAGASVPADRTIDGKNIMGMIDGTGARDDGGLFQFYYYRCRNYYWNRKSVNKVGFAAYRKTDYGTYDWKIKTAYDNDINTEISIDHPDYLFDFTTQAGREEDNTHGVNTKSANPSVWSSMKSELDAFRASIP